jgi:hypothetical protein
MNRERSELPTMARQLQRNVIQQDCGRSFLCHKMLDGHAYNENTALIASAGDSQLQSVGHAFRRSGRQ